MSISKPGAAWRASVLLSLLFAGCQPQTSTTNVEFQVPVTVEQAGSATIEDSIITTGTLRAPELVTLAVMTGGVLEIGQGSRGRYAEGDAVNVGDIIAEITGEDVRLAARREAARLRLETAESNLAATSSLHERGLVTLTAFNQDKNALEDAKLEYQRSLHTEDRNRITSPIDGVILRLARNSDGQPMANGQIVDNGQSIAQIAPLETLVADIDLVGRDIGRVQEGQEARARYHAWNERSFSGEVLRLAPTVNEQTRALRAEIAIANDERMLRPGMFVEVELIIDRRENVPVVPRRAVTERGGRQVVFVAEGQRAVQRQVSLGLGDDDVVEVRSGVSPGERVVVLGLETLTDQMPVRVTGEGL